MSAGVPSYLMPKLRKLSTYILNIYFPMHMFIKYRSSLVNGSVNLFKEISLVKKFMKSKSDLDTILGCLQTNSYFAHPHNILIAMLGDDSFELRKEAVDIILDLRRYGEESLDLDYYLPLMNCEAKRYADLCNLSEVNGRWMYKSFSGDLVSVTEPPLTVGLDVREFLTCPFKTELPCHTQSVERLVKLTTDASKRVCGRVNQSAEGMLVLFGRKETKNK